MVLYTVGRWNMTTESKDIFGFRVYKDGRVIKISNNKEVGFITELNEKKVHIKGKNYSVGVVIYALFKGDGKLPTYTDRWSVKYLDGNKQNFDIDNLQKFYLSKANRAGKYIKKIYMFDKVINDFEESSPTEIVEKLKISKTTLHKYVLSEKLYQRRYRFTSSFETASWWALVDPDDGL